MVDPEFWSATLAQPHLEVGLTPWREAFFDEWARWENTLAKHNPLATTEPGGEDPSDPFFNTFGENGEFHVRNYLTGEMGARATARTLTNGFYPAIVRALVSEAFGDGDVADIAAQVRTWGTTGFAGVIAEGWHPAAPVLPEQPASGTVEDRLAAIETALTMLTQVEAREVAALNRGTLLRLLLVKEAVGELARDELPLALALVADAADPNLPEANDPLEAAGARKAAAIAQLRAKAS